MTGTIDDLLHPAVPAGAYDDLLARVLPQARAHRAWEPGDGPLPAHINGRNPAAGHLSNGWPSLGSTIGLLESRGYTDHSHAIVIPVSVASHG